MHFDGSFSFSSPGTGRQREEGRPSRRPPFLKTRCAVELVPADPPPRGADPGADHWCVDAEGLAESVAGEEARAAFLDRYRELRPRATLQRVPIYASVNLAGRAMTMIWT